MRPRDPSRRYLRGFVSGATSVMTSGRGFPLVGGATSVTTSGLISVLISGAISGLISVLISGFISGFISVLISGFISGLISVLISGAISGLTSVFLYGYCGATSVTTSGRTFGATSVTTSGRGFLCGYCGAISVTTSGATSVTTSGRGFLCGYCGATSVTTSGRTSVLISGATSVTTSGLGFLGTVSGATSVTTSGRGFFGAVSGATSVIASGRIFDLSFRLISLAPCKTISGRTPGNFETPGCSFLYCDVIFSCPPGDPKLLFAWRRGTYIRPDAEDRPRNWKRKPLKKLLLSGRHNVRRILFDSKRSRLPIAWRYLRLTSTVHECRKRNRARILYSFNAFPSRSSSTLSSSRHWCFTSHRSEAVMVIQKEPTPLAYSRPRTFQSQSSFRNHPLIVTRGRSPGYSSALRSGPADTDFFKLPRASQSS